MNIVINRCYGGYSLSTKAFRRLRELGHEEALNSDEGDGVFIPGSECHYVGMDERANPLLVQVVQELGNGANGTYANLRVVEIPDGTQFEIDEYDGMETIHEIHNSWY